MIEKILVLVIIGVVALMFFGNRLPQVLGDLGKGIKAFKEGMNEGGDTKKAKPKAKNAPKPTAKPAAKVKAPAKKAAKARKAK